MKNLINKVKKVLKNKYLLMDIYLYLALFIIFINTLLINIHVGFYVLAIEILLKLLIEYIILSKK